MVDFTYVKNYKDMREYVDFYGKEKNRLLYLYFVGRKDETGDSWCPDCNVAEPNVMAAFKKHADPKSRALIIDVGDRKLWKDPTNCYRRDHDVHIASIPTLLRWNADERLQGDSINDADILEEFFNKGKAYIKETLSSSAASSVRSSRTSPPK